MNGGGGMGMPGYPPESPMDGGQMVQSPMQMGQMPMDAGMMDRLSQIEQEIQVLRQTASPQQSNFSMMPPSPNPGQRDVYMQQQPFSPMNPGGGQYNSMGQYMGQSS